MPKEINTTVYAQSVTNGKEKIKISDFSVLHIVARRWFQRSYGNTYFSVTVDVEIDNKLVEIVNVPFHYGYGDHYDTVALEEFKKVVDLEGKDFIKGSYLSRFCNDNSITVYNAVSDVKRKKDL